MGEEVVVEKEEGEREDGRGSWGRGVVGRWGRKVGRT